MPLRPLRSIELCSRVDKQSVGRGGGDIQVDGWKARIIVTGVVGELFEHVGVMSGGGPPGANVEGATVDFHR